MQIRGIFLALFLGVIAAFGQASFNDPRERLFAQILLPYSVLLLLTSIAALFVPSLVKINKVLAIGATLVFLFFLLKTQVVTPPNAAPSHTSFSRSQVH